MRKSATDIDRSLVVWNLEKWGWVAYFGMFKLKVYLENEGFKTAMCWPTHPVSNGSPRWICPDADRDRPSRYIIFSEFHASFKEAAEAVTKKMAEERAKYVHVPFTYLPGDGNHRWLEG